MCLAKVTGSYPYDKQKKSTSQIPTAAPHNAIRCAWPRETYAGYLRAFNKLLQLSHRITETPRLEKTSKISSVKRPRCLPFSTSNHTLCTAHLVFLSITFPLCHAEPSVAPSKLRAAYSVQKGEMFSLLLSTPKFHQTF